MSSYDLLIIGGGINGAAIAREAALNGLTVLLVEKGDLASGTSSASTKLIHGGLRYLEYYEFKLVREALIERERLLKAAPHLIYPLQFVLPHEHAVRPKWMIRAGLFLYDHLGGRMSLPKSRGIKGGPCLAPLTKATSGFVYSDAWVDDARLVVLNARDAADHGAEIRTRTELLSAHRQGDVWRAVLSDGEVTARALVNAAGPWISDVAARLGVNGKAGARLIRGSHLIVPRLFEGEHAYILQQPDRRIVFAIPYHGHTLVGTTDVPVDEPGAARISEAETDYLLAAVNRYFTQQTGRGDIISTYAGIRSLYDDGASEARQVTRDYVLELDDDGPPLLSIFGGKITTARHLGQVAIEKLARPMSFEAVPATVARIFPGGEIDRFDHFLARVRARWPFLGDARSLRMARAYGSMLEAMIGDRTDLGEEFGAGLSARELDWLVEREWARTAEDVLWRRTKLGLTGEVDESRLQAYLDRR
ncbi:glycerol-3-phosphate dehydrogenase [Sphingomonas changbaiensis NBRC 104936]|uniref:Glycerol-3-phosphate dehydrogenase n=1 Tax=Sphingomonas changbaiensis NBRC 104936 TaxID=1219043 RepID=A0A0E9MTI1_9SPHN|nr:glycerol-3-phosphate dehydrogenase [Sphingomonas changbaiensis]GAO40746.1 glycerol-3-phosphate dehydrogenase [Sphingomonas changbaiensis NBRC 104936]